MHRIGTVLITLALAGCSNDRRAAIAIDPARGVVLSSPPGDSLLNQCSRSVPTGLRPSWRPDSSTIAQLERELGAVLLARLRAGADAEEDRTPNDYARQYAGFYRNNRRVVYVSGLSWESVARDSLLASRWQTSAVSVCDGGKGYFGALYDVESHQFTDFQFNGTA